MAKAKSTAKCKCHGIEKKKESMIEIVVQTEKSKRKEYYCSMKDYERYKENQEYKTQYFELVNKIFGRVVLNTILMKESTDISKVHGYKKMFLYIQENMTNLETAMLKNFSSEYAEIRYFTAILKNNLTDYEPKEQTQCNTENNVTEVQEEQVPVTSLYKKKETKKKRSMVDLFDEL